jgi:DNA-binding HxlR family transcriptional regulator
MGYGSDTQLRVRAHRQWTPLAHALTATGDRWTLLIVLALSEETVRLSVLRQRLPGVSSGVLDHHLTQMVALGLISRERFREMPPRVELTLTERGCELLPIAAALARWGMRHEWPVPDGRASVRAEAILRQLPALLEERDDLPEGTIEAVVGDDADADAECVVNLFQIVNGRLQSVAECAEATTARVEGDDVAWIEALGPARDYTQLRFIGKRELAEGILDALPAGSPPNSR